MTTLEIWLIWPAVIAYALAFLAGLFGAVFRRPRLARVGTIVAIAAFVLQTGAIAARWVAVGHGPVMRTYENSLAGAWFLVGIYFALARFMPGLKKLDLGVLPVALMMLGNGIMSRPTHEPLLPPYQSGWLWIHVAFAWVAYGSFLVSATMAAIYLVKTRSLPAREADAQPELGVAAEADDGTVDRLPGLAVLDESTLRTVLVGFIGHTVMLGCGAIWAHGLWGSYWGWDPVETWSLITWVIYGLYLHLRLTLGWRGRKAAWLAIAAAAAVVVTFGGLGFSAGVHTRLL